MKILHLSSEKSWRGGEQQIAYLIESLNQLGIKNHVAVKKGSEFEKFCIKKKLNHDSFTFNNSLDLKTSLEIKRLVNNIKPDIIHIHTSKGHGIIAIACFLGLNVPTVLSRRVDFPIKKLGFSNWKYNLPQIKKIICVSDEIKKMVQKDIRNPEIAITIYSGVDLSRFNNVHIKRFLRDKYKFPQDAILIGNTSAIADHKDYFTFVDTAEKAIKKSDKPLYFLIIGDGPMKEEINDYIKSKDLVNRVLLTGFLNGIPAILKELNFFLMTSKTEGLGTSILDAFASKLPVISTNGGGLKETVKHLETGMSANVGASNNLSDHLLFLIDNPELKEKLITNAFNFVQKFSKEITAKKTFDTYKSILS